MEIIDLLKQLLGGNTYIHDFYKWIIGGNEVPIDAADILWQCATKHALTTSLVA